MNKSKLRNWERVTQEVYGKRVRERNREREREKEGFQMESVREVRTRGRKFMKNYSLDSLIGSKDQNKWSHSLSLPLSLVTSISNPGWRNSFK